MSEGGGDETADHLEQGGTIHAMTVSLLVVNELAEDREDHRWVVLEVVAQVLQESVVVVFHQQYPQQVHPPLGQQVVGRNVH